MAKTEKIKKRLNVVGVAGEYFVAFELSQKGIIATLTLKNTPGTDVLVRNPDNGKSASIQVKTMSIDNNAGWRLSEKDAQVSKIKNHFYVLVNLHGSGKLPECYVFPQKILARHLANMHQKWLSTPGRHGRKHVDNPGRMFDPYRLDSEAKFGAPYKNNWGKLGLV